MFVTTVSPADKAELIEVPFGLWIWVGPRIHVIDGGPDSPRDGVFWERHTGACQGMSACHTRRGQHAAMRPYASITVLLVIIRPHRYAYHLTWPIAADDLQQ